MDNTRMLEYIKPEIADYGDLQELTEGCLGASGDLGNLQGAVSFETSQFVCGTKPK